MERLSPLDVSFLHIEDDVNHMHIGSVAVFSGPAPRYRDLVSHVRAKLDGVPRYRQRIREVPLHVGRPVWVDDAHFNLSYHLRHTALPEPGGVDELRNLVGRVMAQQLDRTKPLWEMWMVEGVDSDHWALLSKAHHAMVDGVSGADLLALLLDLEPVELEMPDGADEEDDAEAASVEGDDGVQANGWSPKPTPSDLELMADAALEYANPLLPLRMAKGFLEAPGRTVAQAAATAKGLVSLVRTAQPVGDTSLVGPIGPHRSWSWVTTELDTIKRIKEALGGTVNDVVLAAITNGFRELLLARDEDLGGRTVRAMIPVSVRRPGERTYNNRVSAMFATLPIGVEDPAVQLAAIRDEMGELKSSGQAVAAEMLTSLGGFAPPLLLAAGTRAATKALGRLERAVVDTVATNVPGPQQPLYLLGRELLHALPYVPLASPLRIATAIFSYNGEVAFGVTADYETVPDLDDFTAGIEAGLIELKYLADAS